MACRGLHSVWFAVASIGLWASIAVAADAEPALSPAGEAALRDAFAAAERGDWDAANRAAQTNGDALAVKILAWIDYQREDGDATFAELTAFVDANEPWPSMHGLCRIAERRIDANVDDATLLAWFARQPSLTAEGAFAHAAALRRAKRPTEAVRLAPRSWIERDFQEVAIENHFYRLFKSELGDAYHAARLDRQLWSDSVTEAGRMLRRVSRGQRALTEARIALMQKTPGVDGAIRRVPAALRTHPGLWFERMRWRRRKDKDAAALEILGSPHAGLGRPDRWFDEREQLAHRALAEARPKDAYRAITGHTMWRGADFARGEYLAGWIALTLLGDATRAYSHFGVLYAGVRLPLSLARAAYWSGRAAAEMGDAAATQDWFETAVRHPTTYYGQMALRQLNPSIPEPSPPADPTVAQRASFDADELVSVVRILAALGKDDMSTPFLYELGRRAQSGAERALAAELAAEVGRHKQAINIAKRALQFGESLDAYSYPLPQFEIDVGADPALAMALMWQESSFEADATSPAGALGLMQLMPSTARIMAKEVGTKFRAGALIDDPSYNVRLGVAYLEQMLDRFGGSYVLALAAYNAGPGRTDGWIKTYGDPRDSAIDPVDWVELIPYSETRNYVQRVIEAVPFYRSLLGLDPQFAWLGNRAS